MMFDALSSLAHGFSLAMLPENLMFAFFGALLGTLVGVLPGLGPATTIAVLLPITYHAGSPLGAIIMLASIYYGAMYGGSTTSILLKVPGEAASVITCIDGFEMARRGRAGPALAIAAIGSFIAGTIAVVALTLVGPLFARVALGLGPPEYFAMAALGLVLCASLSTGSPIRSAVMICAGVLIGLVGTDTVSGVPRFSFGVDAVLDGIELVPLLMGLFGIAEVLINLENQAKPSLSSARIGRLMPDRGEWRESTGPIARGTGLGFLVGLIPGGGAILGSLLSYTVEKKLSPTPERFGRGAIAGVAGPEAANNAAATSSFVPLLTLGLPGNAVTAVLFAGLLVQGVEPGPMLLSKSPDVFWGVIASMYAGNVMLLALNLPLVGLWVQLLRVPFWVLAPAVLLIAIFGAYSLRNSVADVQLLVISGAVGYVLRKGGFDVTPLVMACILANILDTSLRQSLLMGDGPGLLFTRPVSAMLLLLAAMVVVTALRTAWRRRPATPAKDTSR